MTNGTLYTEYTLEISKKVTVNIKGPYSEENLHKAQLEALNEIDESDFEYYSSYDFTDFEN